MRPSDSKHGASTPSLEADRPSLLQSIWLPAVPVSIPMERKHLLPVLLYPLQGRTLSGSELYVTVAKAYGTMTGLVKTMSTLPIPPTDYQRS